MPTWSEWLKLHPPPSNVEMLSSCQEAIDEAARREGSLLAQYQQATPGDPKCAELRIQIAAAKSDQKHWREMAAFYRAEVAEERKAPRGHWADESEGPDGF